MAGDSLHDDLFSNPRDGGRKGRASSSKGGWTRKPLSTNPSSGSHRPRRYERPPPQSNLVRTGTTFAQAVSPPKPQLEEQQDPDVLVIAAKDNSDGWETIRSRRSPQLENQNHPRSSASPPQDFLPVIGNKRPQSP